MIKNILFLTIFSVSFYCKAQTELNKTDSIGRKQGEWVEFYDQEKKLIKVSQYYIDNNKNGKGFLYTRNGALSKVYFYDNNRLILSKELHTNGKKRGQTKKINGVNIKELKSKYFYVNDSSQIKTDWNNNFNSLGSKEGIWYEVVIMAFFNIPSFKEYYVIGSYNNGQRNGVTRFYNYDNRSLQYEATYKLGVLDGIFKIYDEMGNIGVLYMYKNGKRNGQYIAYYNNGNVRYKGTMKDDKLTGEYFEYSKSGKLTLYVKDAESTPPY
jgi:antitoxin component YwqK of YwqJK toxin-antitoxin module